MKKQLEIELIIENKKKDTLERILNIGDKYEKDRKSIYRREKLKNSYD